MSPDGNAFHLFHSAGQIKVFFFSSWWQMFFVGALNLWGCANKLTNLQREEEEEDGTSQAGRRRLKKEQWEGSREGESLGESYVTLFICVTCPIFLSCCELEQTGSAETCWSPSRSIRGWCTGFYPYEVFIVLFSGALWLDLAWNGFTEGPARQQL